MIFHKIYIKIEAYDFIQNAQTVFYNLYIKNTELNLLTDINTNRTFIMYRGFKYVPMLKKGNLLKLNSWDSKYLVENNIWCILYLV